MALSTYRPDIDGLRAVAVLAVVLNHLAARLLPGGYVGVDVFFVISGYLITSIISTEMAEGNFTFAKFYERRARRIFPALFAVMTFTVVAGYFLLLPSDYASALRATLGTLFFSSNFVFWQELQEGYFAPDAKLNPLLHTWSLAVEEQFYVFFPVLLLVCYRFFRQRILWILLACALISLGAAALLVKSRAIEVFFLSPFRAWELLVGSVLAFGAMPKIRSHALREALVAGGLLAIMAACFMYDEKTAFPGFSALLPVLGAAAVIHAGASGPTLAGRILQWRPVVYIGLISYSLYLWHWPLIVFANFTNGLGSIKPYLPALLVTSLLMASLSYHFVEKPFRYGCHLTKPRSVFLSSGVFVAFLAAISAAGLINHGFVNRFDTKLVELDRARSPEIPYKSCDTRLPQNWCFLGRSEGQANTLLWGDSHLLAWAPALNAILVRQEQRAIFSTSSGCPPLFGIRRTIVSSCAAGNLAVQNHLLVHPEIKTVIMAARWGPYFADEGGLQDIRGNGFIKGTAAAQNALTATIQWLRDHGKRVILIGPVPEYDKSVPLALALDEIIGRGLLASSASEQRSKHVPFLKVVHTIQPDVSFSFLDPVQWMCKDECQLMKNGVSLYRDAGHLSVAGAMSLEADLVKGLGFVGVILE